jgi:hypothetical protein
MPGKWAAAGGGPAEAAEQAIGFVFRHPPQGKRVDVARVLGKQEVLGNFVRGVRPDAPIVFPTSAILLRRGRRSSATKQGT